MAVAIPRVGVLRWLNPHPFNQKEHAAITIMASAAAQAATSTEALAAQELFYGGYPSRAAAIFVTLSSQLIGFGIAGLLRDVLVYPTNMLWPINLPVATLLETLHRDKIETQKRLKVFYIVFCIMFVWEAFPEYIFTLLTGISIFCLARQDNLVFTNLFGGASGNEGLGFLSICLDWNYIAGLWSPLWYPLQTLVNTLIGICGCYITFMGKLTPGQTNLCNSNLERKLSIMVMFGDRKISLSYRRNYLQAHPPLPLTTFGINHWCSTQNTRSMINCWNHTGLPISLELISYISSHQTWV